MLDPQAPNEDTALSTRLAKVRMLVMEMEGVLTDGRLYTSADGLQSIATLRADELGLRTWLGQGYLVAVLARQELKPAAAWAQAAGIVLAAHQGKKDTLLQTVAMDQGLQPPEVAYLGRDLDDLPPLMLAGLAVATADADPWVKDSAHLVLERPGGAGAVRELVDRLLAARLPGGQG